MAKIVKTDLKPKIKPHAGLFKPGNPGNPNGRPPRGHAMTDLIREALEHPLPGPDKRAAKLVIVEKLINRAGEGDLKAVEMLIDRLEGKPRQAVEIEQQGDFVLHVGREEGGI